MLLLKLGWDKLIFFFKKKAKIKKVNSISKNTDDARNKAISNLMNTIQKAKINRPEIIERDPRRAAKVLTSWVKKDEKKLK